MYQERMDIFFLYLFVIHQWIYELRASDLD